MTKSTEEIISRINELRYNPVALQAASLNLVEEAFALKDGLVDTSSPVAQVLGISALNTAAFMHENLRTTRLIYPALARTIEELYPHMSDRDHIGRFAAPVTEKITRAISLKALEAAMVTDAVSGMTSVVIPAGTKIEFGNLTFTQLYAIRIEKLSQGTYMVTYLVNEEHPLFALTSNHIPTKILRHSVTQDYVLMFEAYVTQTTCRVARADMNTATGFHKQFDFVDKFCLMRVYYNNAKTNGWKEIPTTFSDSTYDRSQPTVVLTVLDQQVGLRIPGIYFDSGLISGRLRMELFTTKGAVHLNAQTYEPSAFVEDAEGVLEIDVQQEHRAWQGITSRWIYAPNIISGGADELPFEEVRERTISNSIQPQKTPINPAQLKTTLNRDGFSLSLHIDTPTQRVIFATKFLPPPQDERLVTPGNVSIETFITSFNEALAHPLVHGNNQRITLAPEILYENINGQIRMLTSQEVIDLVNLDKETLAREVTKRDFIFTPFHYVLDATDDLFTARAYYMQRPRAQAATFVDQNSSTGMSVVTSNYSLRLSEQGYILQLLVSGNDVWRASESAHLHCQLCYTSPDGMLTYFSATMVDRLENGDAVFEVELKTHYDITNQHWLTLINGKYLQDEERDVFTLLEQRFSVLHAYSGPQGANWKDHALDDELGKFLLPLRIKAISQEQVDLTFGVYLEHLWTPSRSIKATASYERYTVDVPDTWPRDVYEVNPENDSILFDDGNGGLKLGELLHKEGDPIKNSEGEIVYKARAGDLVIDPITQAPVAVSQNAIVRHVGLFFLEGAYFFTNNLSAAAYRQEMIETAVDWITDRLPLLQPMALENTKIYFAPKTTRGEIIVYNEIGLQTSIPAALSFGLRLSVDDTILKSPMLQESMTRSVITAIASELRKETISRDGFYTLLRKVLGSDVRTFSLTGFWSDRGLEAITPKNESDRCSIGKALVPLPDGDLIVRENVDIKFERY